MSETPKGTLLRLGDLRQRRATPFRLELDAPAREALARELDILAVRKLRLEGRVEPRGRSDWRLTAELGASVVQACGVTLEPVPARIEEPVERLYLADLPEPEAAEVEMPDDQVEPLPAAIDLAALAAEALALALPPFPRAPGAPAGDAVAVPPGAAPLTDEEAHPFAGLAALRERMEKG